MRTFIVYFLLLNAALQGTAYHSTKKCILPKPQRINWNQIRGEWFETVNRKTPLDGLLRCGSWRHITKTTHGFSFLLRDEHLKTHTYSNLPVSVTIKKSGKAVWGLSHLKTWLASLKEDSVNHKIGNALMMELLSIRKNGMAYFTDYKSYLFALSCGSKGQKYIWVSTPGLHPSAESLVAIHNRLIKLGLGWNDVPIYLSACTKTPGIQYFKKE